MFSWPYWAAGFVYPAHYGLRLLIDFIFEEVESRWSDFVLSVTDGQEANATCEISLFSGLAAELFVFYQQMGQVLLWPKPYYTNANEQKGGLKRSSPAQLEDSVESAVANGLRKTQGRLVG
uniref:hypothetical protein n=1 Tax=Microbulbifer agarilyticus TaxID=260552 RepID=UPI000255A773|nr:hypothetical protein [Microbulbifer agarilyticus]